MPHIVVQEFKPIVFPKTVDGFTFSYMAKNIHQDDEKLIAVEHKDASFFLVVREQNSKIILKSDKTTRPASTYLLHKALQIYAKSANLQLLHTNVPQKEINPHLKEVKALKKIEYFAKEFPQNEHIHVEVGFGSGRHLLYQAKNNPDTLFIGIEIHRPSIEQVLKQITIQNLNNIVVLDYDARLFMEQVPSNAFEKIYVHFPVPWDKKPHRRVISTTFIQEAMRVLKVGGKLELRTDSEKYYAYSYETFMEFRQIELNIKKNKEIAISSKYEDRWKKMEKNIYDVVMTNSVDSPPLKIEGEFTFSNIQPNYDTIEKLHRKKEMGKDFFVHFERVYRYMQGMLIKLSCGSFDRPEHLYIEIEGENIRYFPRNPLKSKANLLAHGVIQEVLNG